MHLSKQMGLNVDYGQHKNGMFPCWGRYYEIQIWDFLKYGMDILKSFHCGLIFHCIPSLILHQLLLFDDAGMKVLGKMPSGKCFPENCRPLRIFFISNFIFT